MTQASHEAPASKERGRRGGRFLRFIKRAVLWSLIAAVLLRLALAFALPHLIARSGAAAGLEVTYEDLNLSILGGRVELWGLDARLAADPRSPDSADPPAVFAPGQRTSPRVDAARLARLEYLVADIDVSALLTLRLRVHRVEVDGLDVYAARDSEGAWNFATLGGDARATSSEPEEADADQGEPDPIELGSPVEVRAVRLQHVRLHLTDHFVAPRVDAALELQLAVSDIGSEERPAQLELWVSGDGLDKLQLSGTCSSAGPRLTADLALELRGLHPGRFSPYLEALALEATAETVEAETTVRVDVSPTDLEGLSVGVDAMVSALSLTADGVEEFGIDAIELSAPELGGRAIEIDAAGIRGVRGRARKRGDGALVVGGLAMLPGAPAAEDSPNATSEGSDGTSHEGGGDVTAEPEPFTALIKRLAVDDAKFVFTDESVAPVAVVELGLEELALGDIVLDPARPDAPVTLAGSLVAPGLFERAAIQGTATPFALQKAFAVDLEVTGIAPERATGWLSAAGLASTFESGKLTARVQGTARFDSSGARIAAQLVDVILADTPSGQDRTVELLALGAVDLGEVVIDEATNTTRLASLEIRGARLPLARDPDGAVRVAGLRTLLEEPSVSVGGVTTGPRASEEPRSEDESADEADVEEPSAGLQSGPPARLVIDHIAWKDTLVTWRDAQPDTPVALDLSDLDLELEGLVLGGDPTDAQGPPARLSLTLASPGTLEALTLSGTIASRPGPLDLNVALALEGTGLTLAALEPYFTEFGIESSLADGALSGQIAATVRQRPQEGALELSMHVADLVLTANETRWAEIGALDVPLVRITDTSVDVDEILLRDAHLVARRRADGALEFAETWLLPSSETQSTDVPLDAPLDTAQAAPDSTATAPVPTAAGPTLRLGRLAAIGTRFSFADAAVEPLFATDVSLDAELLDFALGPEAGDGSARFDLQLQATGVLEELGLTGSLRPDPDHLEASCELQLTGLDGALIAGYLPPGVTFDVRDGRAGLSLEARVVTTENGGRSIDVQLGELVWRDGPDGPALLALDRLAFVAPEFGGRAPEAPSAQYLVRELVLEGFEFVAARTSATELEALGFTLASVDPDSSTLGEPPSDAVEPADSPVLAESQDPERRDLATTSQPATSGSGVRADFVPPTVVIERLELGVQSFVFEDRSLEGALPLEASLQLSLPSPTTLLSPDPESLPPIVLELLLEANPIGSLGASLRVAPWIPEPEVQLRLALRELSGNGLIAVLPGLSEVIDGGELDGGSFDTRLDGTLRMRRRSPTDFDLSSGFGAELAVGETAWRAVPEGPILLGFERLDVDVQRIQPESGDIHVASVELARPTFRALQDTEGLHVFGLTLLPSGEPAAEPQAEPADVTSEAGEPKWEPPSLTPTPEFRLDRLEMLGLDFEFRDDSVVPPLVIPIRDMEVLVERFTTRTLEEPRPFQFQVSLYGGEVELPEHSAGDSLLRGILKSAGNVVTAGNLSDRERKHELRPVFDEVAVSGRLALAPAPKGWVKLDVAALELTGLAGPANAAGVTINDGLMDASVEVRLRGEEGVTTSTKTTFDRLSLSEPPDGPISRYLVLPAPLDTVLFVLRNQDGEHVIPMNVKVPADGLSLGSVASEATKTLGIIIADALTSSPFRLLGGVLDLVDIMPDEPVVLGDDSQAVQFAPAETAFSSAAWDEVAPLIELLQRDDQLELVVQHEVSDGDYMCAGTLANPSVADLSALGESLRRKKQRLAEERADLANETRRALALGEHVAVEELSARLHAAEETLGITEAALDEVYELLRPGAERRAPKRTRAACRAIADLRLRAVREALLRLPVERIAQRIDVRRPRIELPPEDLAERQGAQGLPTGGRVTLTPKRRE